MGIFLKKIDQISIELMRGKLKDTREMLSLIFLTSLVLFFSFQAWAQPNVELRTSRFCGLPSTLNEFDHLAGQTIDERPLVYMDKLRADQVNRLVNFSITKDASLLDTRDLFISHGGYYAQLRYKQQYFDYIGFELNGVEIGFIYLSDSTQVLGVTYDSAILCR